MVHPVLESSARARHWTLSYRGTAYMSDCAALASLSDPIRELDLDILRRGSNLKLPSADEELRQPAHRSGVCGVIISQTKLLMRQESWNLVSDNDDEVGLAEDMKMEETAVECIGRDEAEGTNEGTPSLSNFPASNAGKDGLHEKVACDAMVESGRVWNTAVKII
ncbi:uncharacterized protein BJ212DRAFT_1297381 [Suillus subaureus]|uniref:Uncharacterized protein n=1 Tax=Suillus subaureus TaxID=48587 RepID=A0A9P7JGJ6_9AGAM|nr:uncharacterized protein BJ212DRAFT_1297381 [Suillus subaureus]KAG1820889.1 hypothetical protein BJ212DRAFT_1297381 [Suillus subaureus]